MAHVSSDLVSLIKYQHNSRFEEKRPRKLLLLPNCSNDVKQALISFKHAFHCVGEGVFYSDSTFLTQVVIFDMYKFLGHDNFMILEIENDVKHTTEPAQISVPYNSYLETWKTNVSELDI